MSDMQRMDAWTPQAQPVDLPWRADASTGRVIYAVMASGYEAMVGVMDTPELAWAVVSCHNALLAEREGEIYPIPKPELIGLVMATWNYMVLLPEGQLADETGALISRVTRKLPPSILAAAVTPKGA